MEDADQRSEKTKEEMLDAITQARVGDNAVMGVTAVITPTIMQCGQGGYIVVVPNVGIAAKSTFEEALEFVGTHSRDHFQAPSDGPRLLQKVWDRSKSRIRASDVEATDLPQPRAATG